MSDLKELYKKNNYSTDKDDLGYIDLFYNDIFLSLKDKTINMLEIGINDGGSVHLWKDFLNKESLIYALDINECHSIKNIENVKHIVFDAYNDLNINKIPDDNFDLIIDDGPHTFDSFLVVIEKYHKKLKKDAILVVEDIVDIKWTEKLVSLAEKMKYSKIEIINTAGKQKTQRLLRNWSNGLDVLILKK